jgi:hypothetical protein
LETTKEVKSRLELAWDEKSLCNDELQSFDDLMSLLPGHEMAAKASEVIAPSLASKSPSDCLPHVDASTIRCFGAP